jgi:hypothetical protein
MKLFHTLENDLISSYTVKSYLSTLYSGKRLYYLTEYLRSNISPGSDEEEQIKSPITKYLGKDDISLSIDPAPGNDMMSLFQVVKQNFQKWSENCQEIDNTIKGKPQVYSSVFPSKKMKVCTSNLGSFTDYSTMLRVIACDLRQQNLLLSQILLCSLNISEYEITSFCYRAILDPYKNFYFILDSGSLTVKMLSRLKECIQELYKTHRDSMNYNMLIFAKDLGHFKEETVFEQCDNKVKELYQEAPEDPKMNVPKPLMKKSTLTETIDVMNMVLKKFGGVFMSTKAVKSDQAGMGKTTYIRNMISQITSLKTHRGRSPLIQNCF